MVVSRHARLGVGTTGHGAIVNAGAVVVITAINSRALIEHDVQIDNYCHISTGVLVNEPSQLVQEALLEVEQLEKVRICPLLRDWCRKTRDGMAIDGASVQ